MTISQTLDADALLQGDRRALAKAITLVESSRLQDRAEADQLLNRLLPYAGNSIRLGVSGVPGVGKSTFIESFGLHLLEQGRKVAVLAVDPSSPVKGGSILGDKTRMEDLSRHPEAYIRPSPSAGMLGGVTQTTRETMILCEAAGFDTVIVETVGVGQSEYDVANMVDFFLLLMMPNAGDDLQGIKKGILELVDALVINKADGDSIRLAEQSAQHYRNAFHLLKPKDDWEVSVKTCSSLTKEGIDDVWLMIKAYEDWSLRQGQKTNKRNTQNLKWMESLLQLALRKQLSNNAPFLAQLKVMQKEVANGERTPLSAVDALLHLF